MPPHDHHPDDTKQADHWMATSHADSILRRFSDRDFCDTIGLMVREGETSGRYPGYELDPLQLPTILGYFLLAIFTLEAVPLQVREGKYVGGDIALAIFMIGAGSFSIRNMIVGRHLSFDLSGDKILYLDRKHRTFSSALIADVRSVRFRTPWYAPDKREFVVKLTLGRSIVVCPSVEDRAAFLSEIESVTGRSFGVAL